MTDPATIRAISLLSGGLDSQLAIRVLQAQGIAVQALAFKSVFFDSTGAEKAAQALAIPLIVEEFTPVILALVRHPRHGFGSGLNPCIDCHIAMIRRAGEIMRERGDHFVSTGEVLNQRPMSQTRKALLLVAAESGLADFLLRPLSARLLPETEPERRQWVNREKLLALEGRSRKAQVKLAREFGLAAYPQPAGGCLLTDPGYARRLKDLKTHEGLDDLNQIRRLRLGRHFRIGTHRLIVGRNEAENLPLEKSADASELVLRPAEVPGPTAILSAGASPEELALAAAIVARYSDRPGDQTVKIEIRSTAGTRTLECAPALQTQIEPLRI